MGTWHPLQKRVKRVLGDAAADPPRYQVPILHRVSFLSYGAIGSMGTWYPLQKRVKRMFGDAEAAADFGFGEILG